MGPMLPDTTQQPTEAHQEGTVVHRRGKLACSTVFDTVFIIPALGQLDMFVNAGHLTHADHRGALPSQSPSAEGALRNFAHASQSHLIPIWTFRRRWQRGGDLQAASETANYARRLDLQDRYLNSKCSLYFLRADKPKEAEDCMLLFTKVCASFQECQHHSCS